ncbi:MAG: 23S rRNA (guanosine(2251)-2'-O)-methyltransferase RlmB [Alphaproteobacteria bacterium 43-37]|nr:MAG: 23S rRNA (guanosine(2251)-2'-O)-methyltransferase RlmB [Alphaproteobacteria bacterium 43-37]
MVNGKKQSNCYWLYGIHAVKAAALNPKRVIQRIVTLDDKLLPQALPATSRTLKARVEVVDKGFFQKTFGQNIVHQNIAAWVEPLPALHLEDLCMKATPKQTVAVLDQVTDPHNIGAILRSAAAFNISALVLTHNHSPQQFGTIAKAASGAFELIPLVFVTNLARSMETLKKSGFWCIGMDGTGKQFITDIKGYDKKAIVLGSEGQGMRRLTASHCDIIAKIPTSENFSTLNVSTAAAITFYEANK